jgi:chemotaxis protein CheD
MRQSNEKEVYVNSGEVEVLQGGGVLKASAIGSCVVVTVYDPHYRVGGMAHVMLPWASADHSLPTNTKYAEGAMQELMRKMANCKINKDGLDLCLVGGGNLLGKGHENLGMEIARSVNEILRRFGIKPVASELGGTLRRSCSLDVASGCVNFTVGDSIQHMLWQSNSTRTQSFRHADLLI